MKKLMRLNVVILLIFAVIMSCECPTDPEIQTGTMEDINRNSYETVKIGNQWWMAENFKATHYNNGDPILNITNNEDWGNLETGAYCDYKNDPDYVRVYGRLYNWYAVNTGNLCPAGWHVPVDTNWTTLSTYLGGVSVAGGKMKESGTTHWSSSNNGATNESGFTALPGGDRHPDGIFLGIGDYGHWWSITEENTSDAWEWYISYYYADLYSFYGSKKHGFSVRCLKD